MGSRAPILLAREHLPAAIDVLTQAFVPDPSMRFIFDVSHAPYETSLRALTRFSCELRLQRGWPLLGCLDEQQHLVSVAGITREERSWPVALRAVYRDLKACIGPRATRRLEHFSRPIEACRPKEPHYCLGILGVHPAAQGRGYGRVLVEHVQALSEADALSTGVWLETENPANLPFYEHLGYRVTAETESEGLPIWCMFRANQGS